MVPKLPPDNLPNGIFESKVQIRDLRTAQEIAQRLCDDPAIASSITAIAIYDEEIEEDEDQAKLQYEEIALVFYEQSLSIIAIISSIRQTGTKALISFTWTAYTSSKRVVRPAQFWDELWKAAPILQYLELSFYTHEVQETPMPPSTLSLPALHTLKIDAGGAHGNNGAPIDGILSGCPALHTLVLSFPTCDLENCRIRNITWDYDFEFLTNFSISSYNDAPEAFSAFLARHPGIECLDMYVSGDEDEVIELPDSCLPFLQALKLQTRDYEMADVLRRLLVSRAGRRVRHLAVERVEEGLLVAKGLRCLDVRVDVREWRTAYGRFDDPEWKLDLEENGPPEIDVRAELKKCLSGLEELREFGFLMETTCTWFRDESGYRCSDPMDEWDLRIVLEYLPSDGQIQALRMADPDADGSKLSEELLNDFPPVPQSLEYVGWVCKEGSFLYRLQREGGRIRAVECEPVRVRHWDEQLWSEARILDYR